MTMRLLLLKPWPAGAAAAPPFSQGVLPDAGITAAPTFRAGGAANGSVSARRAA